MEPRQPRLHGLDVASFDRTVRERDATLIGYEFDAEPHQTASDLELTS
jgi:hypothetical protein